MQSDKFKLSSEDINKWIRNTLLFSSPAILAFLIALQGGADFDFAKGAAFSALLGSAIDLVKKFIAENKS